MSGPDLTRWERSVRLVATDLDGTLLAPDGTVSPRTADAVRAARASGIHVVPATGRPPKSVWARAADAGLGPLGVCSNGAALVDLDAAFGRGSNAALLASVVQRLDVAVELSGGIRDETSLAAALGTGCTRVNVGTAALESPDWVRAAIAEHGEKIAVGLDVRGTRLAARGWTRDGGELDETLARLEADGCSRYVVTDVTKDGTLTGPNLDLLRAVCARTSRPVIASGGVSSLDDLQAIAALVPAGVEGAIIGKALYAGEFTLEQALAAVAG